jgi:ABC-2 type transport system permease protein
VTPIRQYLDLLSVQLRSMRDEVWFVVVLHVALSLGLVLGMGYLIPDISEDAAMYLVTGSATQSFVTVGLVMLPQLLAQSRAEGRMEYFLTLPISREAYILSLVTVVAVMALPGVAFSLAFGAWYYGFALTFEPAFLLVMVLSVLSLAGVGVAMAVYIPHQQATNAATQLIIFYVLFFSPVIFPASQLPNVLQHTARAAPPTYAADAVRATITDVPGTSLNKDLSVMGGFAVATIALSAFAIRRRG